jgi:hypothetical protein
MDRVTSCRSLFIFLQFWRSKPDTCLILTVLKSVCQEGCVPSGDSRGEFIFSSFPASGGAALFPQSLALGSIPAMAGPACLMPQLWHLLSSSPVKI